MNSLARARHYIDKLPGAVSGDRGHDRTLTVACTCVRFGLTDEESMELLREFNARCAPAWKEHELLHKLKSAHAKAGGERGKMLSGGGRAHAAPATNPWRPVAPGPAPVYAAPAPKAPVMVCPPAAAMDLPEPIDRGAVELLRLLYKPDDNVRIVQGFIDERDNREKPQGEGVIMPVREWLQKADARKGDLATLWSSSAGAGVYIGMNPVKPGGTKDEDVTDYRFALIESDAIPQEEQYAAIVSSQVPVAALIDSGGKSIHAWVRVDAKDRREYDEKTAFLKSYFPWADQKNTNPARLSRLPDAKRKGRRQRLLNIGLGAGSWIEWQESLRRSEIGPARMFGELLGLDTTADPNCVIGFRVTKDEEGNVTGKKTLRYLCRGKSAWLLGPSGVGKSSLQAQFAVGWAIGQPVFGIQPARPLRSLIIQAENDDYDLAEMVQGVASAHGLHPEDERWEAVTHNVMFRTETSSFGARFCSRLREMITIDRPDVVWIDPLLSFAGIDVSKQDQVTPFLRADLTPILEASGVVMIGVHHTGKPKNVKETASWTAIDWAYAGIGSSELVNWARAVMFLRPVEGRLFELKLAKRGSRAGASHPDGAPAFGSVWIQQAQGRIYWEQQLPPEEPAGYSDAKATASEPPPKKKSKVESIVELAAIADFLREIPAEGEGLRAIGRRLEIFVGTRGTTVSRNTSHRVIEALHAHGKLRMTTDGLYVRGETV